METIVASDTVYGRLRSLAAEMLGLDESEIRPESNFQDDLGVDSLDRVELFAQVERAFAIKLTEDEVEKIRTMQALCDCVGKHLS